MIDLHCHLLPGIDDGPSTMDQALALARVARSDGITHAVVTPHLHAGRWENFPEDVDRESYVFRSALAAAGIDLKIGCAGEVRLSDEILRWVDEGRVPYYGELDQFRVMLLEFPHGHILPGSDKLVSWLLDQSSRESVSSRA